MRKRLGRMSEPKSTNTPIKHPFTPGDTTELPVALDDIHKLQLKALKKMTKNELVIALAARNMDTTGNKPILHDRLQKAYHEEAWAAIEPPAEETKLSAIAEDTGNESEDAVPEPQQRTTSSSSNDDSSNSSPEKVDNSKWQGLISQEPEALAEGENEPASTEPAVTQDDGGEQVPESILVQTNKAADADSVVDQLVNEMLYNAIDGAVGSRIC
jgi:hypothetical protein